MSAEPTVQQEEEQQAAAAAGQPEQGTQITADALQQHEDQQCHICMASMTEPTAVKGCGHEFCHSCIHAWVGSRQQPCCPVCRAEVKILVLLSDGTEQEAKPAAAAPPEEAEPDLSCLDHSCCLADVLRLLSRAQSVHNRVYREAFGCGRKGSNRQTGLLLDRVQEVIDTLTEYRRTLEGEVRFDPQVLLQELYRLDQQLTSVQAGDSASEAAAAPAQPWEQPAADSLAQLHLHDDEYDHDHDYYDYDDYDSEDDNDCWHQGLSKTPGRRPTQRHVVKHARSNSGSGQQQQVQQQQQQQQRARGPVR